jgi:hypothetical protein
MEVNGQLHAPAAILRRERAPGTHWIGGWVGSRAGLDPTYNTSRHIKNNTINVMTVTYSLLLRYIPKMQLFLLKNTENLSKH